MLAGVAVMAERDQIVVKLATQAPVGGVVDFKRLVICVASLTDPACAEQYAEPLILPPLSFQVLGVG